MTKKVSLLTGGTGGHGNNHVAEMSPSTYAVEVLRALDELQWGRRLGLANSLTEDELIMAISERAGDYFATRTEMIKKRTKLIETMLYAVERQDARPSRVARAGGMRRDALERWRAAYHRDE